MNQFVETILHKHLPTIFDGDKVAVPDDPEEMNWRLFFAHSQDMQGFRADVFTGGSNEAKNPCDSRFRGLRDRWQQRSSELIRDLAKLWQDQPAQRRLIELSNPMRPKAMRDLGIAPAIELLRGSSVPGAVLFAETLIELRGDKVARKTNAMIRAYVQNSALLADRFDASIRTYLASLCSPGPFPPDDVSAYESRWVNSIVRDYYNVGPAIGPYLICDWLLWLWRGRQIEWFSAYKPDSVHLQCVSEGRLPAEAANDFVAYCRSLRIPDGCGDLSGLPCPPRVLNECIWLELNRSSDSGGKGDQCA